MLHPTHLPFVVPSSIGLICRSPSTSPSFPAKPSRASPAVRSANSALSIPPRFPLIRQFSRKRTMAVCALPSKICVVDLFFCVALSLALCLGRSVGGLGASSLSPLLLLLPQSISFPSGTSSTSSSRTQSARRSTDRRRPVRLHSSPVSVWDPRGRTGSVGDPLQAR